MIQLLEASEKCRLHVKNLKFRLKMLLERNSVEEVSNALRGFLAPSVFLSFETLQGLEFTDTFRIVFLHNGQRWEEIVDVHDSSNVSNGMSNGAQFDGIVVSLDEPVDVLLYEQTSGVFRLVESCRLGGLDLLQKRIFIRFPKRALRLTVRVAIDMPFV